MATFPSFNVNYHAITGLQRLAIQLISIGELT